ncbi:MAG: hypothetical protein ACI9FJ_000102 [Alteromonadaceae bacterium]|jgi:hypothetical protein
MIKKCLIPLFMFFALFSSFGHATNWYYGEVEFAGKDPRGTFLRITHSTDGTAEFPSTMFQIEESMDNEVLAMGMAAIASNKLLVIETDLKDINPGEQPKIKSAYLTNKSSIR